MFSPPFSPTHPSPHIVLFPYVQPCDLPCREPRSALSLPWPFFLPSSCSHFTQNQSMLDQYLVPKKGFIQSWKNCRAGCKVMDRTSWLESTVKLLYRDWPGHTSGQGQVSQAVTSNCFGRYKERAQGLFRQEITPHGFSFT